MPVNLACLGQYCFVFLSPHAILQSLEKMKKIMIIGCCGGGKSTLARRVHEITGIELIHLDQHYWKANWVESEKEEWRQKVEELVKGDSWIIDGNYGGTMEIRMRRADIIVFLNRERWTCLYRVLKRTFLNYGKTRADMPPKCPEILPNTYISRKSHNNRSTPTPRRQEHISSRFPFLLEEIPRRGARCSAAATEKWSNCARCPALRLSPRKGPLHRGFVECRRRSSLETPPIQECQRPHGAPSPRSARQKRSGVPSYKGMGVRVRVLLIIGFGSS